MLACSAPHHATPRPTATPHPSIRGSLGDRGALRYTSRRSVLRGGGLMATKMVTKSIRLSDDEAGAVRAFVDLTGEVEASVLKRAMLRGLQELRVEQAILAYLRDGNSTVAAEVAGLPRARLLDVLIERGVPLLSEPSTVRKEVAYLAEALGSERLRTALAATVPDVGSWR